MLTKKGLSRVESTKPIFLFTLVVVPLVEGAGVGVLLQPANITPTNATDNVTDNNFFRLLIKNPPLNLFIIYFSYLKERPKELLHL